MTDDELLESLDRHFMAGCPGLSTSQLRQHQATGSCPGCRSRAASMVTQRIRIPAALLASRSDGEPGAGEVGGEEGSRGDVQAQHEGTTNAG